MTFGNALIIGIHALVAWTLIEMFVNFAHRLSRASFIICHYLVVIAVFAGVFALYSIWFDIGASAFAVTAVGMGFVLLFEFVVFRFLYSGERWFLNWVDWMFPIFLATSTIYAVVSLW
jgi:TRAP-type uncharacterized transport system fused permease subunit